MELRRSNRINILNLVIILFSTLCIAQEDYRIDKYVEDSVDIPSFDIHLGAGSLCGARIGLRCHFINHFSFETSLGIPVSHFMGGGEREERYGIGINWHQYDSSGFIISLIFANRIQPNRTFPVDIPNDRFFSYLRFSINLGYFYKNSSNLIFFSRLGVIYDLVQKDVNIYDGHLAGPNIDIGIGWCFDLNK